MSKIRYFTLKDGKIYSCATESKNLTQALDDCDTVDGDSILEIDKQSFNFIAQHFERNIVIDLYNGVVSSIKNLPNGWTYEVKEV